MSVVLVRTFERPTLNCIEGEDKFFYTLSLPPRQKFSSPPERCDPMLQTKSITSAGVGIVVQPRPSVPSPHLRFLQNAEFSLSPKRLPAALRPFSRCFNTRRTSNQGCPVTQSAAHSVAEPTKHHNIVYLTCFSGSHWQTCSLYT